RTADPAIGAPREIRKNSSRKTEVAPRSAESHRSDLLCPIEAIPEACRTPAPRGPSTLRPERSGPVSQNIGGTPARSAETHRAAGGDDRHTADFAELPRRRSSP